MLNATGGVSYQWEANEFPVDIDTIPNPTVTPNDSTVYVVEITNEIGCSVIDSVLIGVTDAPQALVANINVVTPNQDDRNDFLEFPGLEKYPDNELVIYNRWGQVVYEKQGYQQDEERWDGIFKNSELPAGAYFYVLRFEGKEIKQAITLMRD